MSRKQSIGRPMARKQSSAGPPEMQSVTVAVLPPRLPAGMAPPSGLGPAGVFGWEEKINWSHNEAIETEDDKGRKKSFLKKIGVTGDRTKRNPDLPPFTFRTVPYDTWRKHYAKDKDGNYKGTHAPAEDCLLKPHDVEKWRLGEAKTKADLWTRGSEALPVYDEAEAEGKAPNYDLDHDDLAYDGPPPGEPTLEDLAGARKTSNSSQEQPTHQRTASTVSTGSDNKPKWEQPSGKIISEGKTAQQIIEEAKKQRKAHQKTGMEEFLQTWNGIHVDGDQYVSALGGLITAFAGS